MDSQPTSASPSGWRHRGPVIALAAAGLAISVYLASFQLGLIGHIWDPVFGTSEQVLDSAVSRGIRKVLLLPDAALGAIAYALEAFLAAWGDSQRYRQHPFRVLAYGAVAAALALTGLGLVGLQAFYLQTWCLLCLASAALSWTAVGLAREEVLASWRRL